MNNKKLHEELNKEAHKTICGKINQLIAKVEKDQAGALQIIANLREIQQDANDMERGLRHRKQIMTEKRLEDAYQKNKGEGRTRSPMEFFQGKQLPTYEAVITDLQQNKIIYREKGTGGVFAMAGRLDPEMDSHGALNGEVFISFFGSLLHIYYSYDQLSQSFDGKKYEITKALIELAEKSPRVSANIVNLLREAAKRL